MLRVMIVDNEAPARHYMRRLLRAHPNVEVVAEASSLVEAGRSIAELKPHAVFMDIEMGDGNGMEMWNRLADKPQIVFVTAYAEHAWRAYEIEAADYLLKPVSAERLASALNKLRSAVGKAINTLLIRTQGTIRVVPYSAISAVLANGDYVMVRLAEKEAVMTLGTLTSLAEQLPSPPFLKLSRSLLINLDHVVSLSLGRGMQSLATFSTGATPLSLGRIAAVRLSEKMGER